MSVFICVSLLILNLIALTYTTQVKSLIEIAALQNISIRNEQELLEKINKLIQGGCDNLQLVTDFDLTLTADSQKDGKNVLNSYEMLRLCPSIPQIYKDEDTKLYLKYKPIEGDTNLSIEEKSKFMVEWYRASQNLLKGLKYPRDELKAIALNGSSSSFRLGVNTLMNWSEANKVPVLVLSSGLGDAVVASLEAANLYRKNVKVVSNFLKLDLNDNILGMKGDPIHSYNKNGASIMNTEYYDLIKERTNVILMGDHIGDATMTNGMDFNTIIKIGFLSKKKRNQLQTYLDSFDIVLEDDQTMNVVNALVNLL